jgi:hypothetical protein
MTDYKTIVSKPLLFMVFNRPEKTKLVWEKIRQAQPQKLYISADGARLHVPDDKDKCEKVRDIVTKVDWDCDVKYLMHEHNNGCSLAGKTAFDWVFEHEEEMIQLEDDVLPSDSFFWFMQEMLERFKDNPKICYVCAENYGLKGSDNTYFFSRYGGSWGWGTWRSVYRKWEYKLESFAETVYNESFKKTFMNRFEYDFWLRNFKHWRDIGGNTYDLQTIYLIHKYDLLNIVPNFNLVTNIGWDSDASNTNSLNGSAIDKFANKPTATIDIIEHPEIITHDPDIDWQWFQYHFLNRPQYMYRLRWALSPFYNQIKSILKRRG